MFFFPQELELLKMITQEVLLSEGCSNDLNTPRELLNQFKEGGDVWTHPRLKKK